MSSDAEGREEVTERQQSKCLASGEGVSQASYAPIAENPFIGIAPTRVLCAVGEMALKKDARR